MGDNEYHWDQTWDMCQNWVLKKKYSQTLIQRTFWGCVKMYVVANCMLYQGFTLLSLQKLPKVHVPALFLKMSHMMPTSMSVCISSCLSAYQHVCLSVCLSACLPICLPACLFVDMPICLSVSLPASLSAYQHVCLYICLSVCLSACLLVSALLFVYLPTCLSPYLPASLSAYTSMSVCLSAYLSEFWCDFLFTKTNTDRRKTFHRCHVLFWTRLRPSSKCGVWWLLRAWHLSISSFIF